VGQRIYGGGIPFGTTITAVNPGTHQATLSANAVASNGGGAIFAIGAVDMGTAYLKSTNTNGTAEVWSGASVATSGSSVTVTLPAPASTACVSSTHPNGQDPCSSTSEWTSNPTGTVAYTPPQTTSNLTDAAGNAAAVYNGTNPAPSFNLTLF
jgi:hypothetical protein